MRWDWECKNVLIVILENTCEENILVGNKQSSITFLFFYMKVHLTALQILTLSYNIDDLEIRMLSSVKASVYMLMMF